MARRLVKGVLVLLATTLLWASSFPFIKIVVTRIGGHHYVWLRGLIALLSLTPYTLLHRNRVNKNLLVGGLAAGIAYTLGLWLQGWGTGLTTASNSAFITGLNVVFVHAYVALVEKRYTKSLATSLALATTGLYLLTGPSGGPGPGDLLVLLGAVAWAAQVILVDRVSGHDPLLVVFFELLPSLLFAPPALLAEGPPSLEPETALVLAYLGLVCSTGAFTLQVYGQRYAPPEYASLVFILEPVFAAIFSNIVLGETLTPLQVLGATLILAALLAAITGTRETTSPSTPNTPGKHTVGQKPYRRVEEDDNRGTSSL